MQSPPEASPSLIRVRVTGLLQRGQVRGTPSGHGVPGGHTSRSAWPPFLRAAVNSSPEQSIFLKPLSVLWGFVAEFIDVPKAEADKDPQPDRDQLHHG
jgi:hypothetical protein